MSSLRLHSLFAVFTLLSACGVVSPPPSPPAAPAQPVTQVTPPPKEAKAAAPPAKPAAPSKTATPVAPKAAPPVVTATAPSTQPIDLKSLELKLKDSKAIGVMTKLSLKNQVDDLVGQFRAFHDGHRPPTLAELRQPYELLLMKVLALVQDQDPGLATTLHNSRDYIWGVLSDRNKFLANL